MFLLLKIRNFFIRLVATLVALVVVLSNLQYIQSLRYDFSPQKPFSGTALYSPYRSTQMWQKCNFHAHANAWGGLTDGKTQTGKMVLAKYDSMQYDIACISDYHSINPEQDLESPIFIPVYEHGHNLFKAHRLALGSKLVSYYDVSLFHTLSDRQYIINRVKRSSPYLAIAHPKFGGGHTLDDFTYLTGYDLIEVLNHYRLSDKYWDKALSAGKAAWIIANDDNHNIHKTDETGVKWTMVGTNELNNKAIMDNLVGGNAYGVEGKAGRNDLCLESLTTEGTAMHLRLDGVAKEIKLIGQNGMVKAIYPQQQAISYGFAPDDTYIRAEITTRNTKMYLNPVVRYDGKHIPTNPNKAKPLFFATWFMRLRCLLALVLTYWLYKKVLFRFPL